jgi:large subunit ribosomal protein L31
MKAQIHPKWYEAAEVKCACGNKFTLGATIPSIQVEVCSQCHPFYTGQMKFLDTAGRVDAFRAKQAKATGVKVSKTERRRQKRVSLLSEELSRPDTLADLRKGTKKAKN